MTFETPETETREIARLEQLYSAHDAPHSRADILQLSDAYQDATSTATGWKPFSPSHSFSSVTPAAPATWMGWMT